ncbi:MAG: type I restriction endonuclease subunit R [Opitutales bacterium]|nr:type I restriction endonuclease subunit R [Opitutales bacterium]
MPSLTSEQTFENAIVRHLVERNGFVRAGPEDYDRDLCLIPGALLRFVQVTQPERWKSYKALLGDDAAAKLLKRVRAVVERKGTLFLLRRGFEESGHHFDVCYFPPASGLNPELEKLFEANVFQILHDEDPAGGFHYSKYTAQSLDLGLFINGLPLFTAEIKNEVSGQTVAHAIAQYKNDRDPGEALFRFGRILCHFAVDTSQVFIATALAGKKTRFLPFNQGWDGGAGNPPSRTGFATAYLWEDIWTRAGILDLAQRFIQVVDALDDKGRATGDKVQIFPRFHQLQTVRKCTAHARARGAGFAYLNQHSAGSGKTIEIATLANSLATLHDANDQVVFKTVIVLSDRRVIDRQLQRELEQFTRTRGMLENIDRTSRQLKAALEDGKKIIVSTIQKFGVIVDQLSDLRSDRFAVIIDEAHSSAAGKSALAVNEVLAKGTDGDDTEPDPDPPTWEDEIDAILASRGRLPHVSYFAFTATPKSETLQLFKTRHPDGTEEVPFTLYTMRQAIEEKFILDVLRNYTTYSQYWHLLKKAGEDPAFDKRKASALLRQFVSVHPHAVARKARIVVDHFMAKVMPGIGGAAKGMIVARSRLHAVRYALAVRTYLEELGNPFNALVAFTDTVKDPETGAEFTEAGMNGFSETKTPEMFELAENRILIVASKYQTGFNQPLLKAMYVDRKLSGVMAVQTLSRLNRTHPGKEEVVVLDFENTVDDIRDAFQPYFDRISLTAEVDPNTLYDIHNDLQEFGLHAPDLVDKFCRVFFGGGAKEARIQKLHALTDPVVVAYKAMPGDERDNFKSLVRDYVKLYGFLAQIVPFKDPALEKFYAFAGFLVKKLPAEGPGLPHEVLNMSDLDNYKPEMIGEDAIKLQRAESPLKPRNYGAGTTAQAPEEVPLSKIIADLNEQFGTKFTEDDRVVILQIESKLNEDPVLQRQLEVGSRDAVRLSFEEVAKDILHGMIESNFKFYKKVQDDNDIARELFDRLFERYYGRKSRDR